MHLQECHSIKIKLSSINRREIKRHANVKTEYMKTGWYVVQVCRSNRMSPHIFHIFRFFHVHCSFCETLIYACAVCVMLQEIQFDNSHEECRRAVLWKLDSAAVVFSVYTCSSMPSLFSYKESIHLKCQRSSLFSAFSKPDSQSNMG